MRTVLLLAAIVLAGSWVAMRHLPDEAQADTVPAQVRLQEIQSVSLDGHNLPLAALRDVLGTRAGSLINLDVVKRDRAALAEALVARGYLAAQVAEPRVTFGAGGAVYVTFAIMQGPLFRIRGVTVLGANAQDAGVVTLGAGDVADANRIGNARRALEERLRVRGNTNTVDAKLSPDPATGLVDVQLAATR